MSANYYHRQPTLDFSLPRRRCGSISCGVEGHVRYRAAAVLSVALVLVTGGVFALEAAVSAAYLPSLQQDLPISGYERIFLHAALFCGRFKWFLALLTLPTVLVLFTIAAFTSEARVGETYKTTPPPAGAPPAIWNPQAAAYWSLIFSPAFGAFLHARNADTMGRVDEAKVNRRWAYFLIAYLCFTFITIFVFIPIPEGLWDLVPIGLLFGWYLSVGKKQAMYVRETWQNGYARRAWKEPLLIASGCLIAILIVFSVAADLVSHAQ